MGPYNIPRNVKDEGRILFIFTGKSIIYSAVGAFIGAIFYFILNMFDMKFIGMLMVGIFALLAYCIGTFKVPDIGSFSFTKKVGGEGIDDIIVRAAKFKMKKSKIYIYENEEVTKDE